MIEFGRGWEKQVLRFARNDKVYFGIEFCASQKSKG
jgi:hypothetical protein